MQNPLDEADSRFGKSKYGRGINCESLDIIHEISQVLNTGLDRELLELLVNLCQCGIDPTALAYIVKHLKVARHEFLRNLTHSAQKP